MSHTGRAMRHCHCHRKTMNSKGLIDERCVGAHREGCMPNHLNTSAIVSIFGATLNDERKQKDSNSSLYSKMPRIGICREDESAKLESRSSALEVERSGAKTPCRNRRASTPTLLSQVGVVAREAKIGMKGHSLRSSKILSRHLSYSYKLAFYHHKKK